MSDRYRIVRQAVDAKLDFLVTTEKDVARLPAAFRPEVVVVQVVLEPESWKPFDQVLALIE